MRFVYPLSMNKTDKGNVYMTNVDGKDVLIADESLGFIGEPFTVSGDKKIKAELNHDNACVLRELFPFTAPSPVLGNVRTMGVGDRLGIATAGHIRVFEKHEDVFPVFAQQSIRELKLTGRTYEEVLDVVTFAVFKYGYKKGFGADGDHLKTPDEVRYALSCGYSMITLDCSEHIRKDVASLSNAEVDREYTPDSQMEEIYIGKSFDIGEGKKLYFPEAEYKRIVLIYGKAIDFVCTIYKSFFAEGKFKADFEISIDETETPTTPLQHFFVAKELKRRHIKYATLAPRFCGEFQKGVDYIGDIGQFEREFEDHATISRHFGYKLSIHSGSDKFSVFPIIGQLTKGVFHLKTAGTNWLEAMHVVALKEPGFYREVHKFALRVFSEAKKYYHVTTDLTKIPNVDDLTNEELPLLFTQNDARQLIHITYGLILSEKDSAGRWVFREKFYKILDENQETYAERLQIHIGRHLELICSEIS